MNPIDIAALVVLALSAAYGLARGFVREVLGLAAWVGAALFCVQLFPLIDPTARHLIANTAIADPVSYAVGFIVLLVVFLLIAGAVGGLVQASIVGGIDRALGLLFGVARGAAILIGAYILGNLVQPPGAWPHVVRGARATPLAYQGALWAVSLVPERQRPHIEAPGGAGAAPGQTVAFRQGE